MAAVVIDIDLGRSRFHLELDRRINFIRGDSGTGKSTLCDAIRDYSNGVAVDVSVELVGVDDIIFASPNRIPSDSNVVLFFDDITENGMRKVIEYCSSRDDVYVVLMSREDVELSDLVSVYEMICEGSLYTLRLLE